MSLVLRCNVCGIHSEDWTPKGWRKVSSVLATFPNMELHVCVECWAFLVAGRRDGSLKR